MGVIWVGVSLHFFAAAIAQYRLINSKMFGLNRLIVNSIFIWLIPFVWSLVIVIMAQPTEGSIGKRGKEGIDGDSFHGYSE
jgi:hypothetical protein